MLTFSLGLAWLLLAPLSLWVLVRGRNGARVGAVVTLALLEAATVAMTAEERDAAVVAHEAPPSVFSMACAARTPMPQTARLSGARDDLTLSWPAAPDECATAQVTLRPKGRGLRVWIREGPSAGEGKGTRTVPVRVVGGAASLRVPLDPPAPARLSPVDGRTGHRIPADRSGTSAATEDRLGTPAATDGRPGTPVVTKGRRPMR
ncbi:hypothetical protein [Nonomuraea aurantiaca]|uniref:hypothetical protein n=1 Tax=Nonomuraea aurantiaca TaxID=2878562 RepID=UPI001CD93D38|nr:hypothetical protein [Nonomuraea aurantiaca]MCA2221294.1 hypothetical protein [Nonomuraea aurantiaca]